MSIKPFITEIKIGNEKSYELFTPQISEIKKQLSQILEVKNKFQESQGNNGSKFYIQLKYKDKSIDIESISDFDVILMCSV